MFLVFCSVWLPEDHTHHLDPSSAERKKDAPTLGAAGRRMHRNTFRVKYFQDIKVSSCWPSKTLRLILGEKAAKGA